MDKLKTTMLVLAFAPTLMNARDLLYGGHVMEDGAMEHGT